MGLARSVGRFIFGKLLPRRPYRVIRGPLIGARFILGSLSGEGGGASVYFGDMEPEQTERMASEISSGDVFFDVGANVGYYSILASRIAGEGGLVVSFEPLDRNRSFLEKHKELNAAENMQIFPFAISDASGTAKFFEGSDPAMGGLTVKGGREFEVETITLDEVASRIGREPTVMKIDVEGAEMAVLKGGEGTLRTARPKIFLSTHSPELKRDCIERLSLFGYSCEPLMDGESDEFFCEFRKQ
ncbi:MAG: FkbM family methyltransferase [Acidobacteriota bacterium]|nr:MAG: FkbM family methyltransferase [Acidobacteriota bacterium]